MKNVVIIGGGISGLCSAYYLVKEGFAVTILDRNDITTGASFINAGYIVPSHFISLAAPGIISKGMKWMLDSSSPFYIKPRLDIEFFKWALRFKMSATSEKVERAIPVLKNINLRSRELYEEMLSTMDFQFHYRNEGLLMVYNSVRGEEEEQEIAERAIKEGLKAEILSRTELRKIQPVFSKDVLGAIHYKCDSHTSPGHFMSSMKKWLEEKGVKFHFHHEVKEIKTLQNKILSIETQNGSFEADEFIIATGSWTSALAKSLGLKIPIQGGKGYSTDVFRPIDITLPAILVEAKVAVTPMDGHVRFAGTMEFSGNNSIIRKNRVEAIANSVKKYYVDVELSTEEKEAAQSGLRPVSPDGLPFIGRTAKYKNLTVAAGHGMMGWSLGPVTGKLVTEIISKSPTSVKLDPFNVDRFL